MIKGAAVFSILIALAFYEKFIDGIMIFNYNLEEHLRKIEDIMEDINE
jgi:hypothetical protein